MTLESLIREKKWLIEQFMCDFLKLLHWTFRIRELNHMCFHMSLLLKRFTQYDIMLQNMQVSSISSRKQMVLN